MAQEIADSKLLDTWSSSGTKIEPDISKIIEGWQLGEQPPHEYMNWLQNTFGSKLNHILKNGIAEWNNETEYLAGASVQHNGSTWKCETTNTNSEPTDLNANWEKVAINKDLTVTVDTLADVRSISYPANTVWASGYHTKNDGAFGSHIFRLKGVKTTETDNDGTVIVATIGGVDYVYELQYDSAVNVKWFGAEGDGVTDDTIPIKNTVLTGKDIKIPQGVFKITDKITGFANNQNIFVFGELKPTVSLFMVIDGVSNVSILSFGGSINIPAGVANNKIDFGNGIHIKNSSKIKIVGFKVTGQESDRAKTAFVTGSNSSVNCIITENEIINIGTSCWIGWTDTTSNQDSNNIPTSQWLVENNIFNNCGTVSGASSISIRSKDNTYDRANPYAKTSHTIKNNNILNFAQGCGIEYWSNGGLIDGNKIIGNNSDLYSGIGISLAKSYDTKAINNNISGVLGYQGIELATCNNCVVIANTIYGITSGNANSAGVGISVAQINDPSPTANIISNNSFISCKRGVILGGSGTGLTTGTIISNNSFDSATDYGVYIASGTKITTIEKNDFNSCKQGIYSIGGLTDGSSYIDIINNTFRNTTEQVVYNENGIGAGRPFRFMNNYVHGWGTATKPQAIMARCVQSEIIGNSFVDDGRDKAGFPGSYAYCVNRSFAYGAVRHIVRENKIQGVSKLSIGAISGDIAPINANNVDGYWNNYSIHSYRNSNSDTAIGNVRIMDMANAPTAQSWLAGDVVYNSNPTAGGYTGWICTVSGTPGSWKGFGLIQA